MGVDRKCSDKAKKKRAFIKALRTERTQNTQRIERSREILNCAEYRRE